jgi:hypothetical protein
MGIGEVVISRGPCRMGTNAKDGLTVWVACEAKVWITFLMFCGLLSKNRWVKLNRGPGN